jgi:hypothetical protein
MSALHDLDHAHLRRTERRWLDQAAERLRRAAEQQTTDDRTEGTDR